MFDGEYADDPAQTFGKVLGYVGVAQTPEELSPPVLEHVYSNGGATDADKKRALAEHIAMNSTLTKAAAATIVDGATTQDGKTDTKQASVAASSASAIGVLVLVMGYKSVTIKGSPPGK
jgi:hypothetical protein